MGNGRFCRGFSMADLDDNDWFGQRHLTRGREKSPRVANRLHVKNDALGMRVVTQIVDQIPPADIEHGTNGNESAEANIFAETPIENGRTQCAALTDETHITRAGHAGSEGCIQSRMGRHYPQAIGTDDAYLSAPGLSKNLLFQVSSSQAALPESSRNDNGSRHYRCNTFTDDAG